MAWFEHDSEIYSKLLKIWKPTSVVPISKKVIEEGNPSNYRPVSQTFVVCKILEKMKRVSYLKLCHSLLLENPCAIWDPFLIGQVSMLEYFPGRVMRFIAGLKGREGFSDAREIVKLLLAIVVVFQGILICSPFLNILQQHI